LAEVSKDGPAALAGLKAGDVVTRIDGRPVVGEDDIQQALAERDAGQEVTLDYKRGEAAAQVKVKLTPRVP
jgi:putative serine protease PepD